MRKGFTLIEVLLAVGLSVLLILIATLTFRSATRAISDLKRLADENRLLRSGYSLVMDDVDFWHSHANPGYPYLQRHMSQTDNSNSALDKNLFRPVSWPKSLDDARNPNWSTAADPRSWYRNHLRPNNQGGILALDGGNRYLFRPDFVVNHPKDINRETQFSHNSRIRDPGWEPWHLVGDYAALANVEMPATGPDSVAGARAVQQWHVFKELGAYGCFTYLPPGSPTLIQLSSRNETPANYVDSETRMDTNYCKGEIPWALQATGEAAIKLKLQIHNAARENGSTMSYPGIFKDEFPDYNRLNYVNSIPSAHRAAQDDAIGLIRFGVFSEFDALATDQKVTSMAQSVRKDSEGGRSKTYAGELSPLAIHYPPIPNPENLMHTRFDWADYNYHIVNPLALLDTDKDMSDTLFNGRRFESTMIWQRVHENHVHRTSHMPSRYTNGPLGAITEEEAHSHRLTTSIHRYQFNGNDKAQGHIQLANERGNLISLIKINAIGTTLRGARQYWGRRSGSSGVDDGLGKRVRMGDHYD